MIQDIEYHDWICNSDSNSTLYQKSINAYFLNKWYEKIPDLTFKTIIYPIKLDIKTSCPDILPFEKCMVRYENKSPKDSELWGPATSKQNVIDIFYTSLRCKTNKGQFLCFREWQEIGPEYRCFWNQRLVAVGSEVKPPISEILEFITSIQDRIPYYRCVMDIAKSKGKYYIVEFNSWETNSGAKPFDWYQDVDILYPLTNQITFRWQGDSEIITSEFNPIPLVEFYQKPINFIICKPQVPAHWLVMDDYIYIANDIWLGRFTHDLVNINWKRGNFRFHPLELDNGIRVGNITYDMDLSIKSTTGDSNTPITIKKYGLQLQKDDKIYFAQLNYNGSFTFLV